MYDYEEVLLNEPGCAMMLSEPFELFHLNLNSNTPSWAAPGVPPTKENHTVRVSQAGLFNCLVTWYELDMGEHGGILSFAPNMKSPRHMYFRHVKQRLFFIGYEQRVTRGDLITIDCFKAANTYSVVAPADNDAANEGTLVRWPLANVLSYHFPMIAEYPRNVRFERALLRAIRYYTNKHGRGPHVLDIGSGTGLLAMMAARGGARKVTSVEMVPAVCAVASQIVERNGYGDIIEIINIRSDELSLYTMGNERADLLVSELIDDHVIGDGVLPSISDARNRLLTPEALIVPRASKMYIQPVSYRSKGPPGILLDDINVMRTDQLVLSFPYHSGKLQRCDSTEYEILGPALEVFDFDWSLAEPGSLEEGRTNQSPLTLKFSRGGVCNCLMILFTLQMDAKEGMEKADGEDYDPHVDNDYSSGMDNEYTHWDNPMRFLPVEINVAQGDELQVVCSHNAHDLDFIRLFGVTNTMLREPGGLGSRHLVDSEMGAKLGVSMSTGKWQKKA